MMKFGGLSEEDVKRIEVILSTEGIAFEVSKDNEIEEFNASSLHNNLRHLVPSNLSLHVLAISIEDNDFQRISAIGKKQLLEMGITDEAPLAEDFTPYTGQPIQKILANNPQRMIAFNLKHQLIAGVILLIIIALVKYI